MVKIKRVILLVMDSVGIGALPDAHLYGDQDSNTLDNIARSATQFQLPNLCALGLGNIDSANAIPAVSNPIGAFGKAIEKSLGKDTTTGHWELCGTILDRPFPTFPDGFPPEFILSFEEKIGVKILGNVAASGTDIILELGDEHLKTKFPIVYTSADSVFQIAMHEDLYSVQEQYEICKIARDMLVDGLGVGRVIARPFEGDSGNYRRTHNRRDFSIKPPPNLLNALVEQNLDVVAVGKIFDIFAGNGITKSIPTRNNNEGISASIKALKELSKGLIFTNLVDFDMLYGHRRDVNGYAYSLMEFDNMIPQLMTALKENDLLIITADHGNDPTATGSDHTREYVPILHYGKTIKRSCSIGVRNSFADIGATIAQALGVEFHSQGKSYFPEITK